MNLTKSFYSNIYSRKIWNIFLLTWGLIMGTQFAIVTSQLQMEANAILNSGWWNTSDAHFNISNRCSWSSISCNEVGSIKEINIYFATRTWVIQFEKLNMSVFHNLEKLDVIGIGLRGSIPKEIGLLSKLAYLGLRSNSLVGELPPSLGNLKRLEYIDISFNNIHGSIPSSLGNLTQLEYLYMSNNYIQGSIPLELGFLNNLQKIDLSHNRLSRNLPIFLTNLTQLQYIEISNNFLTGSLPSNFDQLTKLKTLRLKNNFISGTFSISMKNLSHLETLEISHNLLNGTLRSNLFPLTDYGTSVDLSHNLISGEIPSQLGHFYKLNLSNNNLSGMIPQSLCNVFYLDISYNCLKSPIPHCTYLNPRNTRNKDVCIDTSYDQLQPHSHQKKNSKVKRIVFIVLPILFILTIAFSLLMYFKRRHNSIKNKHGNTETTNNGDLFCIWNYDGKIAYNDIIRATKDFDIKYCIGKGAYGSVYKAQLPSGKFVALKKLHSYEAEVPSLNESFRNEVKILSEIKHRNIVKLYGFCLHKRDMFLIYHYMEKGSLFSVLHDDVEAIKFNWRKRINTIKGVAHALSYLHHDFTSPIVHRDVSTSNILLNSEWQPSVSDFGIARLLEYDSSNRTSVGGTVGYIAPGKLFIALVFLFSSNFCMMHNMFIIQRSLGWS